MSTTRSLPLASALLPRGGIVVDALLVVGFSLVTALFAQISIPLPGTTVPLTGQTLAVLLAGAVLGSRRGAMSQVLYVLEGAAGLPVFAGGTAIVAAMARSTYGFLVGFIVAAFVVGWLSERGWSKSVWGTIAAMTVGHVLIYAFGIVPFILVLGQTFERSLDLAVWPFIPSSVVKIVAAALVLPDAWRLIGTRTRRGK